jgi:hypothetical protein
MARILLRSLLPAALLLVAWSFSNSHQAHAQDGTANCLYPQYGRPDLFYNYYAQPQCGGVGADMYPAPVPTPPLVGHTYYTYQPLMPHEYMYRHHRIYHQYYNYGRGWNRTRVIWW